MRHKCRLSFRFAGQGGAYSWRFTIPLFVGTAVSKRDSLIIMMMTVIIAIVY